MAMLNQHGHRLRIRDPKIISNLSWLTPSWHFHLRIELRTRDGFLCTLHLLLKLSPESRCPKVSWLSCHWVFRKFETTILKRCLNSWTILDCKEILHAVHIQSRFIAWDDIVGNTFFPNAQRGFPFHFGGLGVPVSLWGSGGKAVFAQFCVCGRNRPQAFATVCVTAVRLSSCANASGVLPKVCQIDSRHRSFIGVSRGGVSVK